MNKRLFRLVSNTNRLLPGWIRRGLYRLGPISRLIRGGLNQILPSGLEDVYVSGGVLSGMRLRLDLQLEKDYWLGTYEMDLQLAIDQHVQPGWVAYDVGANIGYISLILARSVGSGGQVHAFEALPTNLDRLRQNLEINSIGDRVKVNALAVTGKTGLVNFLIGPSGATGKVSGSAGRDEIHQGSIQVMGIALDDYVFTDGNPIPQVVKMDIEGGETLALVGMARLLGEFRPLTFLELHGPDAAKAAWGTFSSNGYRICRMKPGLPQVQSLDDLDWKAYLVAVP